jgi:hypothetical protein
MGASRYVHLDVERIVKETDAAFLCLIDGEEHWIPRSQVADDEDYREGDEDVELSVTEWFADKEGLA